MKVSKLLVLLNSFLFAASSFAGSVLEVQTTERRGGAPIIGAVDMSILGSMSRLDITSVSSNESGAIIFNGDTTELIVIDNEQMQYYVISQQQMNAMASQVGEARRQMEQALEEMPAEQRALARQMMQLPEPEPEAPPTTLKKTGESDTVGDHDCEFYDVMQEERRIRDVCITPWDEIDAGREAAAALIKLGDFFESMREAFSESGGTSLMDRQQDLFGYMEELDGYPVLSRDYSVDGVVEYESRLLSAERAEIDPAIFTVPEDYKQHSLP